ncbi:MAG: zinc ribbon domain-containing protein [Chloroflexi bacterium]|nr:zinc ribbon domain-containing protein [Chloroflexota bacterium]
MPVYDYHCAHCNSSFPVRKQISELDSPTACPECQSTETQRLISLVAIFSSSGAGQRRALAGAPSCSGCGSVGSGCAGCHPR